MTIRLTNNFTRATCDAFVDTYATTADLKYKYWLVPLTDNAAFGEYNYILFDDGLNEIERGIIKYGPYERSLFVYQRKRGYKTYQR